MKKLFTFLLLGCAATMSAQQLPNSSFDNWKSTSGITYLTATTASSPTQTRPGVEPEGWNGSNINQIMNITSLCTQGTDEESQNNYVILKNYGILGNIVPAYMTLGSPWVFAYGSGFAMMNYASMGDGGTFGGVDFSYRPDALRFKYTRPTATEGEVAHAIAYLWKGTYTSNVPTECTKSEYTAWTSFENVDRVIVGKQTDGVISTGELVASLDFEITGTSTEWQEVTIPFQYTTPSATPEKMNVTFSAGEYWTRSSLKANSELHIDDVEFVYYSQLQSLSYDGTAVENFNKNTYEYSIDAAYDATKLEAQADGVGATIEQSYDEATGKLTITVKGDDWSEDNKNEHVYTIQFKTAVTTNYTNGLSVGINGQYTAPQETTIQLIEQVDGTYSFVLKNFYLDALAVGNIQLDNLTLTDKKISTTQGIAITAGDDPDVDWFGPTLTLISGGSIPVELNATVYDNEKMTAEIAIDMTSLLNQMINVTFAPTFTLNSSTSIGEETSELYNVEFNRSFPAGWSTICLPFATTVTALGATQAQEFTAFENNTLEFTKVSTGELKANTPYLIYFEQAKDLSAAPIYAPMEVENSTPVAVTFGDVTFTGNYTAGMSMEGYYGVAEQNGSQYIMKGGNGSTLGSTGAYFTVTGTAAQANSLILDLDGVVAINGVEADGAEAAFDVYTVSGVKVRTGATSLDGLQRGLYIVNGKKVLVK